MKSNTIIWLMVVTSLCILIESLLFHNSSPTLMQDIVSHRQLVERINALEDKLVAAEEFRTKIIILSAGLSIFGTASNIILGWRQELRYIKKRN